MLIPYDSNIIVSLSIGYVNKREENFSISEYFTQEEWDEMTEEKQYSELNDIAEETMNNYIEISFEVEQ